MRNRAAVLMAALFVAAIPFSPSDLRAQTVAYIHDELGRLIRAIDETTGEVATYHYDAVGNILSTTRGTIDELQPGNLSITPPAGRAASSVAATITGENLLGASVGTDNAGIQVTDSRSTDTIIEATFVIAETARQGSTVVTVDNSLGAGTVSFTVWPPLPKLTLSPRVLALTPGTQAPVAVNLSNADVTATTVSLAVANSGVATVASSSVTIPAGQVSASAMVSAGMQGTTVLTAQSDVRTAGTSIYVTQVFRGTTTTKAAAVSVEVKQAPPLQTAVAPLVSVGVAAEQPPITAVAPLVSVGVEQAAPPQGVFAPPVAVEVSGEGSSAAASPQVGGEGSQETEGGLP